MKKNNILAIIPARYASSRFPGKPLIDIAGKTMIERVYEQVGKASCISQVIVATDDDRIYQEVKRFGGQVEMTGNEHLSGTDRVGEVAEKYPDFTHIINIQGDEPLIDPRQIDAVGSLLIENKKIEIATLVRPILEKEAESNPNVVKAVLDKSGKALYFSRSQIPFPRNRVSLPFYQHIGIYGFRRKTLLELIQLPQSSLEEAESLEQLRWLYHGYNIYTAITDLPTYAVDTPEDLQKIQEELGK